VIGLRAEWEIKTLPVPQARERVKNPRAIYVDSIGDYVFQIAGTDTDAEPQTFNNAKAGQVEQIDVDADWGTEAAVVLKGNCIKPFKLRQVMVDYVLGG